MGTLRKYGPLPVAFATDHLTQINDLELSKTESIGVRAGETISGNEGWISGPFGMWMVGFREINTWGPAGLMVCLDTMTSR